MNAGECWLRLRVRYVECDAMGYVHHSHFLTYFEMGRTELLRRGGISYRELEARGFFFVVVKISASYKRPARYDDELELLTRITNQTRVRIDHGYALYHADSRRLLCEAASTIACVDRDGKVVAIPDFLRSGI